MTNLMLPSSTTPPSLENKQTTTTTLVSFYLFEEIMISCLKLSLIDQLETA